MAKILLFLGILLSLTACGFRGSDGEVTYIGLNKDQVNRIAQHGEARVAWAKRKPRLVIYPSATRTVHETLFCEAGLARLTGREFADRVMFCFQQTFTDTATGARYTILVASFRETYERRPRPPLPVQRISSGTAAKLPIYVQDVDALPPDLLRVITRLFYI